MPRAPLPFRSHVVASDDDPYGTLERARAFTADWGSELTVLHGAGHINAASGFGPWAEGYALLEAWLARASVRAGEDVAAPRHSTSA